MTDTNTPAENLAEGAPTPENDTEPKEYVTLAADDEDDGDDSEGEEGSESDASEASAHKRRSGAARAKERIQRLERELAEARQPLTERPALHEGEDTDLKEPKESDFDNWLAYQRALQQYDSRKAYREERKREAQLQQQGAAQREHEYRIRTYNRNLDQVRDRVPDFDRVIADARENPISDAAQELILESQKGPLLAYYLAKNPDRLAELNRMSPTAAAREIGRLEARIRAPTPRAKTNAKPPPKPQRGSGGTSPAKNPANMSMAEYNAWRDKGGG